MIFTALYKLIRFAICLYMPKEKPRQEWTIDDVKAMLAEKANGTPYHDWGQSIVDLCKLLGFEATLEARRDMYQKAGGEGLYQGTAAQNMWLHAHLMQRLAEQGFVD